MNLTVEAVGYLNGIRLFSVEDGAHASGRIALYCWGNSAAHFNELLVTPVAAQLRNRLPQPLRR
ncbi:hypothetical protein [Allomesorhizobium camelthorni]|uniref:Uncharacterized protein n=1 Tax=Allomesorhizobium camelthorni TaxID=475069 RepID=A0A6G4WKW6_9HYPH|nr:hypothetical protein [Mesorhizobium camelthorni]NGO54717.1 hypothetical protein [Mesorhizobium camelthorni]